MTKDEALKLALEALTNAYWPTEADLMPAHNIKECADAITAIKEALMSGTDGAQPEQEPVGWAEHGVINWLADKQFNYTSFLYATPPQRKPLTDEEIAELWLEILGSTPASGVHEDGLQPWRFARAIEAAHGIKGEA